jgi:hypothetical protein
MTRQVRRSWALLSAAARQLRSPVILLNGNETLEPKAKPLR